VTGENPGTDGTFPSFQLCHKGEAGLTGIGGGLDGAASLAGSEVVEGAGTNGVVILSSRRSLCRSSVTDETDLHFAFWQCFS
jgi:hypothetical protein